MEKKHTNSLLLLVLVSVFASAFASNFVSADAFGEQASIGRNLLQAKKACPVNFEFLNYTIITSQCKGPRYPANLCCSAFAEFACPYADAVNDLTNDCATTMFSYINLYGKYPPGLFASECTGNKEGLPCPASSPTASASSTNVSGSRITSNSSASSANVSGSRIISNPSPLLILSTGLLVLLWQFL